MLIQPALGARFRLLRERDGRSIEKLANAAGVTYSTLQAIETGETVPSLGTAFAVAGVLGCSIEDLVGAVELQDGVHAAWRRPKLRAWIGVGLLLLAGCATTSPYRRAETECKRQVANEMGYDLDSQGYYRARPGTPVQLPESPVVGSGKRVTECLRVRGY